MHTTVITTGETETVRLSLHNGFNGVLRDLPGGHTVPPSPRGFGMTGLLHNLNLNIESTQAGKPDVKDQAAATPTMFRIEDRGPPNHLPWRAKAFVRKALLSDDKELKNVPTGKL